MLNWKSELENLILYLPTLSYKNPLFEDDLCIHDQKINCKINKQFLTIWKQGPKQPFNKTNLSLALGILGHFFAKLSLNGKKKLIATQKKHKQDLVTNIDQGIEALFRVWIQNHFGKDNIIGEEGLNKNLNLKSNTWHIDPIDGTHNFVNNLKHYCLQIAYLNKNKEKICYLNAPLLDKTWSTLDSPAKKIPTLPKQINLGTEFLQHKIEESRLLNLISSTFNFKSYQIKSIGLNIMALTENRIQVFYKRNAKIWDIIPPSVFIHHYFQNQYVIKLLTKIKGQTESIPFLENDEKSLEHFKTHSDNFRIGHLLILHPELQYLEKDLIQLLMST